MTIVEAGLKEADCRAEPMELAGWFMDRWERETGREIGDGAEVDLALLDECLNDYASQCAALRVTPSLFEVSA